MNKPSMHKAPGKGGAGGFTLIELLVTVAIVAIISAVAIPNYVSYVERSHRATAQSILLETAQFMERYYTTNNSTYEGAALATTVSPKGATGTAVRYNIKLEATGGTTPKFTVTAEPANKQTDDECGTMTVDSKGAQTAVKATCWPG